MADPGDIPTVARNVALLESALGELPPPVKQPLLVLVCGLPGSGKSHFSRRLAQDLPLALVPAPTYSAQESARLFSGCHALIRRLLSRGVPVLFDATNLAEYHRQPLYNIASKTGAETITVFLTAPKEVVKKRLARRRPGFDEAGSDADWQVYLKLLPSLEPPARDHHLVDTSRDIGPALANVAEEVRQALGIKG